jgi:hypothetical protein
MKRLLFECRDCDEHEPCTFSAYAEDFMNPIQCPFRTNANWVKVDHKCHDNCSSCDAGDTCDVT